MDNRKTIIHEQSQTLVSTKVRAPFALFNYSSLHYNNYYNNIIVSYTIFTLSICSNWSIKQNKF